MLFNYVVEEKVTSDSTFPGGNEEIFVSEGTCVKKNLFKNLFNEFI